MTATDPVSWPSKSVFPMMWSRGPSKNIFVVTAIALIILVVLTRDSILQFSRGHLSLGTDAPHSADGVNKTVELRPPHPPADDEERIAMCTMVKASPYFMPVLNEWLTHHYHHHGIRRFYIVDDGSVPPLESQTFSIPSSAVSIIQHIPDGSLPEGPERAGLYENRMHECVFQAKGKNEWVGLIDIDEFLEMRTPEIFPTLQNWLKFWESQDMVGAISVQTLSHSSAGLLQQPKEGFRKKFTRCISNTTEPETDKIYSISQVKQFVRTMPFQGFLGNIHVVNMDEGYRRVAEFGEEQNDVQRRPRSYHYWAIHHYSSGSREYFEKKAEVGDSHGKSVWAIDEAYWNNYHKNVVEYDCDEMTFYDP